MALPKLALGVLIGIQDPSWDPDPLGRVLPRAACGLIRPRPRFTDGGSCSPVLQGPAQGPWGGWGWSREQNLGLWGTQPSLADDSGLMEGEPVRLGKGLAPGQDSWVRCSELGWRRHLVGGQENGRQGPSATPVWGLFP